MGECLLKRNSHAPVYGLLVMPFEAFEEPLVGITSQQIPIAKLVKD